MTCSYDPQTEPPPTVAVELTEPEIHVLTCAMAGNFPGTLDYARMSTLRKLAKAHKALTSTGPQGGTS